MFFFLRKNKQPPPVCESSDLAGGDVNLQPTGALFLPTEGLFSSPVSSFFKGSETSRPLNISAWLTSQDRKEATVPSNDNKLQLISGPALKFWFCTRVLHMIVQPSFRHGPIAPNCFKKNK